MRFVRLIVSAIILPAFMSAGTGLTPRCALAQGKPTPSMKEPARPVLPPARMRKWYDRARNVTYVNVDIPLRTPAAPKGAVEQAAPTGELTLVFQLIFKGAATAELATAYLLVQATAGRQESARLSAVEQIELDAEGYQYSYARVDYQTELIEATGKQGPLPLKREAVAFQLLPEDLPQIANGNSLKLKLGAERFTVKSPQLAELRSALVAGGKE